MVQLVEVSALDPAQAGLFDVWATVFEAAERHVFGDGHDAWSADQRREMWAGSARRRLAWAALDGDVVVGATELSLPLRDNLATAGVDLAVLPDHRRRGVGSVLLERVEEVARQHDRTVLLAETRWPADGRDSGGEDLAAPRGMPPRRPCCAARSRWPTSASRPAATASPHGPGTAPSTATPRTPSSAAYRTSGSPPARS